MARNLTSNMLAEIVKGAIRPVIFCEIGFTGGTVYLFSGSGTVDWNGHTWTGAGKTAGISPISETTEVNAVGIQVWLSGIPTSLLSEALTEVSVAAPCNIWLGLVDSTGALLADPYESFSGTMDAPQVEESGDTCKITLNVESRLIDLERPRVRRYTDQDQQMEFPGDRGMEYVAGLQDWQGQWGNGHSSVPSGAGVDGVTSGPGYPSNHYTGPDGPGTW